MDGFLNVLKPPGMTSHDVVSYIRKITGIKKVGHTGTLDPEAAGVLPICIGKATKAAQYITDKKKIYRAIIKLGVETDTQDKYGKVLNIKSADYVTDRDFENVINKYIGKINQVPSIYSAIRHKGKKLYHYAYQGESPDIKSREIEVFDIVIIDKLDRGEYMLDIACSKGTYIRTLCHDIGNHLGCGAHMSQLIRLESHPFRIEEAKSLEEIRDAIDKGCLSNLMEDIDLIFSDYIFLSLKDDSKKKAMNGNPIFRNGTKEDFQYLDVNTKIRLYFEGNFIAIGEVCFDSEYNNNFIKIKTLFV